MRAPTIVREPDRAQPTPVDLVRARGGGASPTSDTVAVEEPLEIRLNGWRWLVTMRTPGDDADLIVGLLAAEGAVTRADEVERILFTRHPDEPDLANVADVHVHRPLDELQRRLGRNHPLASASCGLCGASTIEAIRRHTPALPPGPVVSARALATLPETLVRTQAVFRATGGLHAAALFDGAGALLAAREDIGRHNATDKVLGWQLRSGAAAPILLVSGRASFEIVQKALVGRVPIVAAVSAPSNLAIALARAGGMTLIGFLRGRTMNVYTGPERVTDLAGLATAPGTPASDAALAAAAVELIPRAMRTLLDTIQLKISLADWQALTVGERTRLLALAAEDDTETFGAYLCDRTVARTGRAPRPLAPRSRKPAGA